MPGSISGDDARELLAALRVLRDAGLDPTVIDITPNDPSDQRSVSQDRSQRRPENRR